MSVPQNRHARTLSQVIVFYDGLTRRLIRMIASV